MQITPSNDVFQDSVTQLAKTANKQKKLVFVGAAIGIAVLSAVGLYVTKRSAHLEKGREAFYSARQTLEGELKTVQAGLPKPPAPPVPKRDPKAPPIPAPVAPEASLDYERFAVGEKLSKSVTALETVGKEYSGVMPGFEAYMLLGQTFAEHGEAAERARAAGYFEKAAESAPNADRAVAAHYGLAYAQEAEGKFADAAKTFERVLNYGATAFQVDAMRGLARNYELQNDATNARKIYDRILATFPNTDHARFAQMKLAAIPETK